MPSFYAYVIPCACYVNVGKSAFPIDFGVLNPKTHVGEIQDGRLLTYMNYSYYYYYKLVLL